LRRRERSVCGGAEQEDWPGPLENGAQFERKEEVSFSTPASDRPSMVAARVISPSSGAVYAYDPKNGRELWRVRYAEGYSVVPRPVFGHGLLFISTALTVPR